MFFEPHKQVIEVVLRQVRVYSTGSILFSTHANKTWSCCVKTGQSILWGSFAKHASVIESIDTACSITVFDYGAGAVVTKILQSIPIIVVPNYVYIISLGIFIIAMDNIGPGHGWLFGQIGIKHNTILQSAVLLYLWFVDLSLGKNMVSIIDQ